MVLARHSSSIGRLIAIARHDVNGYIRSNRQVWFPAPSQEQCMDVCKCVSGEETTRKVKYIRTACFITQGVIIYSM